MNSYSSIPESELSIDLQKDFFEKLYNESEIIRNKKRIKDKYEYKTFNLNEIEESLEKGWEISKKNKNSMRLKKEKPRDKIFENKVWGILADMGYNYLNKDRNLRIKYTDSNTVKGKQIDVFAVDAETVLLIECKTTTKRKTISFQKDILEIVGIREKILSQIRKLLGGKRKVAWIFCTENIIISDPDKERLKENSIHHIDQDELNYYEQLVSHLGSVAKYQFYSKLFSGQTIPELKNKVPAIKGKMGGYEFYSFSIEPDILLKISYILHRTNISDDTISTYQRMVKKSRLDSINKFISDGNFFPNSIIININSKKKMQFDSANCTDHDSNVSLGVLHLPRQYKSAFIIDGQHRLLGFGNNPKKTTETIPVVAFENLPANKQSRIFIDINHKQKSVPANLLKSLDGDLMWDSPLPDEAIRALKSKLAEKLNYSNNSPLYNRIILGEEKKTNTKCITLSYIFDYALNKTHFFGKHNRKHITEQGVLYDGDLSDKTLNKAFKFFCSVFSFIENGLPEQWEIGQGEGGFIARNIGISSIIVTTWDILEFSKHSYNLLSMNSDDLFGIVKEKLNSIVEFIKKLSFNEIQNYSKQYGSSGVTKIRREFQRYLNSLDSTFLPEGLEEFLSETEGEYNDEVNSLCRKLQTALNIFVIGKLKELYNDWWRDSVPKTIQKNCVNTQIDSEINEPPENFLLLMDYKEIITTKENWKIFSITFTEPGLENKSKPDRVKWFVKFNSIRNKVNHPEREKVQKNEYEFIKNLADWLLPRLNFPQ